MIRRPLSSIRFASAVTSIISLAFLYGCGRSDLGAVSGRVTYRGEPRSGLEVRFNPEASGRSSVGYTDSDGNYTLQYTPNVTGALVGQHNVSVTDRSGKTEIPAKFSNMRFEVKSGSNTFDIAIPAK